VESREQWTLSGVPRTYQYNESGRLTRENYTGIDVDILMDFQIEYSYPADSLKVIRTLKKHPGDTAWYVSQTEEKVYHPDGRIKNQTVYSMHNSDGSLKAYSKTIWQYQENGSLQLKTDYLRNGKNWLLSVRTHYYYPPVLTSIDPAPEAKDLAYPNPTTGTVWFSDAQVPARVSVYHRNGQLMKTFTSPGPSLDLSFLQPGTYLLVIESSGKAARRIKINKAG
jgi:antitoxin component YwqK of YwqJK toxin-antitoxin module